MTGAGLPVIFLCLGTGCALGALFLLLKAARLALGAGKWATAGLDVAFGLVCGGVAFLTALVVDKGRMRFLQGALQMLGAWGCVAALDPFMSGLGRGIRRFCGKLGRALWRPVRWAWGKIPKPEKKARPKKKGPGRKGRKGKRPKKFKCLPKKT